MARPAPSAGERTGGALAGDAARTYNPDGAVIPLYDTIPSRNPPVAMWFLIGLHVVLFLLEVRLPARELVGALYTFGLVPAELTYGAPAPWWTLVTCVFLHAGWLHLLANMWTLWIFGDNVEDRTGPVRFVVFYVLCGVAAAATEYALHPTSTTPVVGASGAIAGVMGAYLAMFPRARIVLLVPILFWSLFVQVSAFFFLFFWLLLQVLSGGDGTVDGIAYGAHVGGFVAGLVLHRLFVPHASSGFHGDEGALEYAWGPPRRRG